MKKITFINADRGGGCAEPSEPATESAGSSPFSSVRDKE